MPAFEPRWDPERLAALHETGYCNAGPVFSAAELATIAAEYDRLVTLEAQTLGNERDGVYPYRAMLNFRSPALRRFLTHPRLLEIAVSVLGPEVRFWWDQGINKLPGSGSPIPWHQDNGYTRGVMPAYLTCWLALDDSSLQNGGLEVLPGSHAWGSLPHAVQGAHAVLKESSLPHRDALPLDARAGDLLVFSSLLVHQTVGNRTSDRQRRAWVIQYCRGDQRNETTGEVYDNRAWVVCGGEPVAKPWSERRFSLRDDAP